MWASSPGEAPSSAAVASTSAGACSAISSAPPSERLWSRNANGRCGRTMDDLFMLFDGAYSSARQAEHVASVDDLGIARTGESVRVH
jgi:hypothetical protein